jgi:rhodanese-related sulfurtransferase
MNTEGTRKKGKAVKRAVALLVVLVAVTAGVAPAPVGAQKPAFTLAVLRQDGILLPFATFDHAWTNYWPEPRPTFEVPISLEDVDEKWWPDPRLRVDWLLWLPDGRRLLKALAPVWFRAQCANIGLRTDYRPRAVPPPDTARMKVGSPSCVARCGRRSTDRIVEEDSQDGGGCASSDEGVQRRRKPAIRARGSSIHTTLERMVMPIAIEALYRTPDTKPGSFITMGSFVAIGEEPEEVQDPPATSPPRARCDGSRRTPRSCAGGRHGLLPVERVSCRCRRGAPAERSPPVARCRAGPHTTVSDLWLRAIDSFKRPRLVPVTSPRGLRPSIPSKRGGSQDGAVSVLDVRRPAMSLGHIPGARLLPVDLIATTPAVLRKDVRPVLVVCEHGVRSVHAARFLARAGVEPVLNLAGGMSR